MERWTNRVAIITGAGSGIGAAVARFLAENAGMRLAIVDLELSSVQKLAGELNACKQSVKVHALQCDVSKEEDVLRVVKWTRDNLGGADVIVNAAGVYFLLPLAVCLFNREVIKDMRDRKVDDGHLFNICSLSGQYIMEVEGLYPYAASKHSIRVLTEGMRRELRDLGTKIRITVHEITIRPVAEDK
ncbi:hypothetical protein B566_EDAN002996 [Ephemera danica]|nr:hypothetical protein B566_EDAN002996 [Ephemera danica]